MVQAKNTAPKGRTQTQVFTELAQASGLSKAQVTTLFEQLSKMIADDLGTNGPGVFTLPGLAKLKVVRKPATPERKGVNPFTGQETTFKAKPARNTVKIQPVKRLKDMV